VLANQDDEPGGRAAPLDAGRRGEPFAEVAWIRDELGVEDELAA
jgi:hypothetical protein